MQKNAISPTRQENYPEWYQQVISAADMAEISPVRGCMVIKPWGYAIWENIQQELDKRLKAAGHVNAYFPLLMPLSMLEKEAAHIDGFAKECAVVTHSALESDGEGGLKLSGKLEEPLIIRPTSEAMIGTMYAKWIQSYRDLPILINQWANVMRWEMRTRLFLRTSEFLWQEGHTAHATSPEALEETLKILDIYTTFAENILAMPVIKGEKTSGERFPGAVNTYTIEALMQDKKALQAGTSHFLGQNFSTAYNIEFLNPDGHLEKAWTTSWGVSTRLIGGLIMTHGDDDGLILPPAVAPYHVVILPIYRNDEERAQVLAYCDELQDKLKKIVFREQVLRVYIDKRDLRGGEKNWQWIKKGVPIRVEIGPRDIAKNSIAVGCRHQSPKDKQVIDTEAFISNITILLDNIQTEIYTRAKHFRDKNTVDIKNIDDFNAFFSGEEKGGFARCYAADDKAVEAYTKPLKVSARCIPSEQDKTEGKCIFTGKIVNKEILFAKAY
jgi:prolyl-tRNA synthetase